MLDDNVTVNGDKIKFYHHGRIAVGNIGRGKIDELRIFVESIYSKIVFVMSTEKILNLIVNLKNPNKFTHV